MLHHLEPLSRVLRSSVLTDTSVEIPGRPPNTLEAVRDRGWLQGLQQPTKEEKKKKGIFKEGTIADLDDEEIPQLFSLHIFDENM